ncbi:MAG: endonuclease/exonuclease/phosphatase family protein [Planctomycetota bacterium]
MPRDALPVLMSIKRFASRCVHWVLAVSGGTLLLFTILAYAAPWWWVFAGFEAFRIQTSLGLTAIAVAQAILPRRRWLSIVWLAGVLINAIAVLPWTTAAPNHAPPADAPTLRVMQLNVQSENRQFQRIADHVHATQPDLVFFQEMNHLTRDHLVKHLHGYRLHTDANDSGGRGIGLFVPQDSTLDIRTNIIPVHSDQRPRQFVHAEVQTAQGPIHLLSVHIRRPGNDAAALVQQRELNAIAQWAEPFAQTPAALIALGDFNMVPWSHGLRKLRHNTGLTPARQAWHTPTWPITLPRVARVTIDLAIHTPAIQTSNYHTGPDLGSDHLPLHLDIRLVPHNP